MARYLLDSSALFTLIEDEPGAQRVEQVLRKETVFIPWLALLELRYVTEQELGPSEADARYALSLALGAEIVWNADEPTLLTAARFKAAHRVSLADSIIAAVAHRLEAVLLHKDPEYDALTGEVQLEALPYKRRTP